MAIKNILLGGDNDFESGVGFRTGDVNDTYDKIADLLGLE